MTSRQDYCNSLLYGANGYLKSQLQLCQNNAIRVRSKGRKFDHITPAPTLASYRAKNWIKSVAARL